MYRLLVYIYFRPYTTLFEFVNARIINNAMFYYYFYLFMSTLLLGVVTVFFFSILHSYLVDDFIKPH